ncbi:MAG TPA: serine/threonine-protein kinase [Anaerolineae bacterium]|nr:serine/threonine-protein kinase [Anaerolineae bacterium]
MEDLIGRQIGPYRVIAPLGRGSMAAIYRARRAAGDRFVALKVLPRQLATDPVFVSRFHQEALVVANLHHPNILPLEDFGEADGYTYMAVPLIETGTLADYLRNQPLPLEQVFNATRQLCAALHYAHGLGVVHRDVKPANVLVDEQGTCLLTDFGVARMLAGTAHLTKTGLAIGTPAYMSPEQGLAGQIDGRSDIYSLGVMLYQMLTGRLPFDAKKPVELALKHIYAPAPLPRTFNPALTREVEQVILKALAKQPDARYATAAELAQALGETLRGKG